MNQPEGHDRLRKTPYQDLEALVDTYLGPNGLLLSSSRDFRYRDEQHRLAKTILDCLVNRESLIAEAGTGIGKTFAYLIPALTAGATVVISTASKTLQDQLYNRDLPRLAEVMGRPVKVARLKGRSNYVCAHRLNRALGGQLGFNLQEQTLLHQLAEFSRVSPDGDLSGFDPISRQPNLIPAVTSTMENCLGHRCAHIAECAVMKAREEALEASVVIVNHHLLCSSLRLLQDQEVELLTKPQAYIIDEAHGFLDIASDQFTQTVSSQALTTLARDLLSAGQLLAASRADWPGLAAEIERSAQSLRLATQALGLGRYGWPEPKSDAHQKLALGLSELKDALRKVQSVFSEIRSEDPELQRLEDRLHDLSSRVRLFQEVVPQESQAYVQWLEQNSYGLSLHRSPLSLADVLAPVMQDAAVPWLFLSATLSLGGGSDKPFQYFKDRLGLQTVREGLFESPFCYKDQGLLVIPKDLPDPKSPDHIQALLRMPELKTVLSELSGGLFILCTSLRAVSLAASELRGQYAHLLDDRLLLVQGERSREAMLELFRQQGNAILVGSASFWEGVDVPGQALSMVIIDKLPFAPPDDPVLRARIEQCERTGGSGFRDIQCPEALLSLKQGVGRLIRTEHDRGICLLGDRRLVQMGYGRKMLEALPKFRRSQSLTDAIEFVKTLDP
ncbi:MAG: ATP-dependent DNA helicase [Burkholderiaceae bacterium]